LGICFGNVLKTFWESDKTQSGIGFMESEFLDCILESEFLDCSYPCKIVIFWIVFAGLNMVFAIWFCLPCRFDFVW
jgi:hypothetical protein